MDQESRARLVQLYRRSLERTGRGPGPALGERAVAAQALQPAGPDFRERGGPARRPLDRRRRLRSRRPPRFPARDRLARRHLPRLRHRARDGRVRAPEAARARRTFRGARRAGRRVPAPLRLRPGLGDVQPADRGPRSLLPADGRFHVRRLPARRRLQRAPAGAAAHGAGEGLRRLLQPQLLRRDAGGAAGAGPRARRPGGARLLECCRATPRCCCGGPRDAATRPGRAGRGRRRAAGSGTAASRDVRPAGLERRRDPAADGAPRPARRAVHDPLEPAVQRHARHVPAGPGLLVAPAHARLPGVRSALRGAPDRWRRAGSRWRLAAAGRLGRRAAGRGRARRTWR